MFKRMQRSAGVICCGVCLRLLVEHRCAYVEDPHMLQAFARHARHCRRSLCRSSACRLVKTAQSAALTPPVKADFHSDVASSACILTCFPRRVQEASEQETRLIVTGKYKELQRLNIKRAIGMMIDNYDLAGRFVRASAFAPSDKLNAATQ